MDEQQRPAARQNGTKSVPVLEWVASAVGLALMLAIIGFIGWKAYQGTGDEPPMIEVRSERIVAAGGGWIVEFVAVNRSPSTAAAVQIEGKLSRDDREVATSQTTLDYVPGRSERGGGLFFEEDPRAHQLSLRALGYTEP